MKKLYTLALAAACTMSAAAIAPKLTLKNDAKIATEVTKSNLMSSTSISMKRVTPADGDLTNTKGYDSDTKKWTIDGTYEFVVGDYYSQTGAGVTEIEVTAVLEDGIVWFVEDAETQFLSELGAIWDETTSTLLFPQIPLGKAGTYYAQLSPFIWNNTTNQLSLAETMTATFDATTGEITFSFPENCDGGLCWAAYADENYTTYKGLYKALDFLEAAQFIDEPIDEVQEGQWKKVGTAKISDAWITPVYAEEGFLNPEDYTFQAELQQSVDNENLYRVWRPYHSEEFIGVTDNTSEFEGQIVFDITDPAHVIVKPGMPAGCKNEYGEFYVYGLLGWQIFSYGDSYKDEYLPSIIEWMEEKGQEFDTYADGVVSVNLSIFDNSKSCSHAYTWNNNEYVVSKIELNTNAVEDLTVIEEAAEAPVYYNLQGVRVSNPVAGQLLIKKQGESVSKVLVK